MIRVLGSHHSTSEFFIVFQWPVRLLLSCCALLVASGCALDNSLVYQPTVYPEGDWHPPGLAFEDAWFTSDDGTKLHGWYCHHPRPRAVVLVAHGNAGNLSSRWPILKMLNERLNIAVMIFDYRGFGKSQGKPTEKGVLADARAARAWLAARTGVQPQQIVLLGRSLGGGVMVDLAASDGARGLILESTFTSLPDVAARQMPWSPVHLSMSNRLDSLSKIKRYHGPLLQSHGDKDRVIPYEFGKRLFAAAPGPKRFITIPGAGHNWALTPEYIGALDNFFVSLSRPMTLDEFQDRPTKAQ